MQNLIPVHNQAHVKVGLIIELALCFENMIQNYYIYFANPLNGYRSALKGSWHKTKPCNFNRTMLYQFEVYNLKRFWNHFESSGNWWMLVPLEVHSKWYYKASLICIIGSNRRNKSLCLHKDTRHKRLLFVQSLLFSQVKEGARKHALSNQWRG